MTATELAILQIFATGGYIGILIAAIYFSVTD